MTLTQPCAVSGEFTFAEGQESQTFTVPIIDDHLYDGNKTVTLYISNPTLTATIASPIVATLTIVNTDLPAPTVSPTVQLLAAPDEVCADRRARQAFHRTDRHARDIPGRDGRSVGDRCRSDRVRVKRRSWPDA